MVINSSITIPFDTGLSSKPMTPAAGSVRFNTTTNDVEMWNGTSWLSVAGGTPTPRNLVFDTGTVYGARYYTVKPEGYVWAELEEWCTTTFGSHGGAIWGADPNKAPLPNERWYMNNSKFWFRNEKDRNWFTMRWTANV